MSIRLRSLVDCLLSEVLLGIIPPCLLSRSGGHSLAHEALNKSPEESLSVDSRYNGACGKNEAKFLKDPHSQTPNSGEERA